MKLHENKPLFRQAILFTAQEMGIPEIYVEKDYWVTFVLHAVFNNPVGHDTVFKGGTALLKCFYRIERFSEDVDLIALRRDGETDNKLKNKLKAISNIVGAVLPEVEVDNITRKRGMTRKTAHTYAKEFNGDFGQVRDVIIVEATWLGYYEPYSLQPISSFIYKIMEKTGQGKVAEEYGLLPFEAKVLDPKRTLCEKIMSLVRFSYSDEPIEDLKKKIRHAYDLHQLLKDPEILEFFNSTDFDTMLLKVGNDDMVSFKNNNKWLENHPSEALIFSKTEEVWQEMKDVYNGDFKFLVFSKPFPREDEILASLKKIKERLSSVNWNIEIAPK